MFQAKRQAAGAAILGLPLIVMGCAMPPAEPVVASFNEASVGIQLDGTSMEFSGADAKAKAVAKADAKAA